MDEARKFLSVMGMITLRKGMLYKILMENKDIDSKKLEEYISGMDIGLFISDQEKSTSNIDPNLTIDKLGINTESIINDVSGDAK